MNEFIIFSKDRLVILLTFFLFFFRYFNIYGRLFSTTLFKYILFTAVSSAKQIKSLNIIFVILR